MLSQARSALETFKNQWYSGANQDEFELSLYASAQDEYDSGAGNKGLLAKVGAEVGFDENKTKAGYLKARTAQLMGRKESILAEMLQIQTLSSELEALEQKVKSITHDQSDISLETAKQTVERQMDMRLQDARNSLSLAGVFTEASLLLLILGAAGFAIGEAGFASGKAGIAVGVLLALWYAISIYRTNVKELAIAETDFNEALLNKDKLIQDELDAMATEERKKAEVLRNTIGNLMSSRDSAAQRLEVLFQ
jgi:prefoldin subunit 5